MIKQLCLLFFTCGGALAQLPQNKDFADSFRNAWFEFEAACTSGDARALTSKCDERVIRWLAGKDLSLFLGEGWKVESIALKRRLIISPHEKYDAVALVFVDITEFGRSNLQLMLWVFRAGRWRCCNLPFESTIMGSSIKYPPFTVDADAK